MLAITFVVASIVVSCKNRIGETDAYKLGEAPLQRVDSMFAVETENGRVTMRLEARVMEHYETDSLAYDSFPEGLSVYGYTDENLLETVIISDEAKHLQYKNGNKAEIWQAFGNVVIHNVIKKETMETDTIYWDQSSHEIYTDCYVKMYSSDGFMQGYGMRSDDRARNAILHNPFNGYAVTLKDTTAVIIDSVNFIGPFPKK